MSMIKVIYQVQHKFNQYCDKMICGTKINFTFLKKTKTILAYSEGLTMEVNGVNRYSENTKLFNIIATSYSKY